MKSDLLSSTILTHFEKKLPFVVYALPGETAIRGLFQQNNTSLGGPLKKESGFILSPFNTQDTTYVIPAAQCKILNGENDNWKPFESPKNLDDNDVERANHMALVAQAIELIHTSGLEKVVVSRKKEVVLNRFRIVDLYRSLFSEYTTAFRYLWYHPDKGLWCGATPELLLSIDDLAYKTMSLAGTRLGRTDDSTGWTDKEYREQKLVTDAILEGLKPFSETVQQSGIYTSKAGNLEHLRTDISGRLSGKENLEDILEILHPTPAVCGRPRPQALEFIRSEEGYDRSFYTGYVGLLNDRNEKSDLFVNLRCMSIKDKTATLYTGGGITAGSNPEDEWKETCNKQQTMLKLLSRFL
jgi:isochorismate synthase